MKAPLYCVIAPRDNWIGRHVLSVIRDVEVILMILELVGRMRHYMDRFSMIV